LGGEVGDGCLVSVVGLAERAAGRRAGAGDLPRARRRRWLLPPPPVPRRTLSWRIRPSHTMMQRNST